MGDEQWVDDQLVPSGLVCLPAIVPEVCIHANPLVGGRSVIGVILKGRGEDRQYERRSLAREWFLNYFFTRTLARLSGERLWPQDLFFLGGTRFLSSAIFESWR